MGALQLCVDRLNSTLGKVQDSESSLKEKVQSLSCALSDSNSSTSSSQEKMGQLQKLLTAGEHERRILQVSAV